MDPDNEMATNMKAKIALFERNAGGSEISQASSKLSQSKGQSTLRRIHLQSSNGSAQAVISPRNSAEVSTGLQHELNAEKYSTLNDDELMSLESPEAIYAKRDQLRIVMVGKTGSGKSATGNSIIGTDQFESKISGHSVTKECKRGVSVIDRREVLLVDTPGLFDTKLSADQISQEIIKCVQMTVPGPHIFLLVLQIARFTSEEIESFNQIFEIFGKEMGRFSVILFTRLDDLKSEQKSIESYIDETGRPLTQFIEKCNGHYFALDNKAPDSTKSKEIQKLFELFNKIVEENGGKYFSNDLYKEAERPIITAITNATKQTIDETKLELEKIKSDFDQKIATVDNEKKSLNRKWSMQNALKKLWQMQKLKLSEEDSNLQSETQSAIRDEKLMTTDGKISIPELDEKELEANKTIEELGQQKDELERQLEGFSQQKKICLAEIRETVTKTMDAIIKKSIEDNEKRFDAIMADLKEKDAQLFDLRQKMNDKTNTDKKLQKRLAEQEKALLREKERLLKSSSMNFDAMYRKTANVQKEFTSNAKKKLCTIM